MATSVAKQITSVQLVHIRRKMSSARRFLTAFRDRIALVEPGSESAAERQPIATVGRSAVPIRLAFVYFL